MLVKELIREVELARLEDNTVLVSEIIGQLKIKGYPVANSMFTYFSRTTNMFVYCGKEPSTDSNYIPISECKERLILKCRHISSNEAPTEPSPSTTGSKKKNHPKRNKERKISEVIEKVSKWRQLYTGSLGPDGRIEKCSLEEAALKVGIAKKTLDDYLLQLRAGKKYGFNFNAHKESKVGVLRTFVKSAKSQNKHPQSTAAQDGINQGKT